MTTLELNASLLREVSAIITDDELTAKAVKFIRSLRREKKKKIEEALTKEEFTTMLKEGLKEVVLIKEGKLKGIPAEEVFNDL